MLSGSTQGIEQMPHFQGCISVVISKGKNSKEDMDKNISSETFWRERELHNDKYFYNYTVSSIKLQPTQIQNTYI